MAITESQPAIDLKELFAAIFALSDALTESFDHTSWLKRRMHSLNHTFLGDELTQASEVNPIFSCLAVGEPALSFCVGDGGREPGAVQLHLSHGYLVYPSACHWRTSICSCGD